MDKNAIKKFAVWARRELIARVSQKADEYGIDENNIIYVDSSVKTFNGKILSAEQINQRNALIAQINEKGYRQVMEEVAYTWFNRFIALRFMEVNNYLPSHIRVFTDEEDNFKPQIITEAIHLELDGLNMDKVYALKEENKTDELYRYLLITQCNALNKILPKMFQKIADYTELLLPDNLLREGSVIEQMLSQILEDDWKDAVQIIGWLYQYYNAEKKDEVFANLKKNIKITKENIPAATQLFTPDWIVRYMVENSLGRLWVEGHPNNDLKANWKYYLEEAEQEPKVQEQLDKIRKEYAAINPEQIKCIDPCCGSGHILVYMFDVLVQIYESYGYNTREAVNSIIKNNIYGLDIDDRAAQLAYFAVMMKARQYDRRFFNRELTPHIYNIQESNSINREQLKYFGWQLNDLERSQAETQIHSLLDTFKDAKEYGAILQVEQYNWELLYMFVLSCDYSGQFDFEKVGLEETKDKLFELVQLGVMLSQKYDVVCTNPPYMGASGMGKNLSDYVKKHYPDSKSDLFALLMESCGKMAKKNGYQAMITQHAWMFLSSFEKLRTKLLQKDIVCLAHLGIGTFEDLNSKVVQSVSFVMRNSSVDKYSGIYDRLFEKTGLMESSLDKQQWLFDGKHRFISNQENFSKIPGSPVAYWVSEKFVECFDKGISVDLISDFTGSQHKTADNEKYLRYWWEINRHEIEYREWIFYIKGGEYRKWYGNIDLIVDWRPSAREFYSTNPTSNMIKERYWFADGITYTSLTSSTNGFRYLPPIGVFDIKGPSIVNVKNMEYCLGFFNSKIAMLYLKLLNPTITLQVKDVKNTPVVIDESALPIVSNLVKANILFSEKDWDSFETSWDFKSHPFVAEKVGCSDGDDNFTYLIEDAFDFWKALCNDRFNQLKANEEELNRIFIDIYGLQDELTPEVEDKDITVRKADLQRDIKSLISYAVGCMFGRYSPLKDGLLYAGGDWDYNAIQKEVLDSIGKNDFSDRNMSWTATFIDKDNIIPICDDEYFTDDIVGKFIEFIELVYGKDTLNENLKFIADALGGKGQPKDIIRNYFLNDFYKDHCKIYQKRPIYWLFDSGKKNGFKALIYMHRYQPDTIARIRTDYVHEQQARYHTAIDELEKRIASATTSERVKLSKELKKLTEQGTELRTYEEKIHHLADQMISIDLDDGVKVNYAKFQDVLAKIK